jgi:hypothetical protein
MAETRGQRSEVGNRDDWSNEMSFLSSKSYLYKNNILIMSIFIGIKYIRKSITPELYFYA